MTVYAVRYVEVAGITQTEMQEHATTSALAELPEQHDQVWLGGSRYSVKLREIDATAATAVLYVVLRGERIATVPQPGTVG